MSPEESVPAGPALDPTLVEDLRLRLRGALAQESAWRGQVHRLTRELAVAHRLLQFYADAPPPVPQPVKNLGLQRAAATLLTRDVRFHLDGCRDHGLYTAIKGWAFCAAPAWNGKTTVISLHLRGQGTVYTAGTSPVPRPDVAAHFAGQPPDAAGGAVGLEGVGFACEVLNDSLPTGLDLEIILHLECAGMDCERSTGQFLRL